MELGIPENSRILIVDDNQSIHEDFQKILAPEKQNPSKLGDLENSLFGKSAVAAKKSEGYEIDHAFQGQEALEMVKKATLEKQPYALIFVDMRMPPGWDGLETITKIWEVSPESEVVICSAYSDYSWTDILERLGRTDRLLFLKKPFEVVEVQQMALALVKKWNLAARVRLQIEDLERLVMERTIAVTAAMQSIFLPRKGEFKAHGISTVGHYQPALLCGGDWWWYDSAPDGKVLVILSDVTGHGPGAAMVTAAVASSFLTLRVGHIDEAFGFGGILDQMNSTLLKLCRGQYLVTVTALEIDPAKEELKLYNAGGMPLFVRYNNGKVETFGGASTPLGAAEKLNVGVGVHKFSPGSRALIFTDGVADLKPQDKDMLGIKKLAKVFESIDDKSIDDARTKLIAKLTEFRGGSALKDDLTFAFVDFETKS